MKKLRPPEVKVAVYSITEVVSIQNHLVLEPV